MKDELPPAVPEVWAGIECTMNRVGDGYFDQLARTGHDRRPGDIDRLAGLGVRAVRYPVLWEQHAADPREWSRTARRLDRLRELGMRPILGLVHHGSGPPHTALTDPGFAEGLATFAAAVAQRFPWADAYTPVNEPLTTARFAGLYGHWYPHGRDDRTFVRCLLNQCRAVVLAMRAIRRVRPDAALVQTEDLGHTHAPRRLQYQASFENSRRCLPFDLLTGRVDHSHALHGYLCASGATQTDLAFFVENPCPPDLVGANYYVTSERYLDDRLEHYPVAEHGGNGRHRYADTEAVRVLPGGPLGLEALLAGAWERYRLPLVVTEAHLGCDCPLEQARWLVWVWNEAVRARAGGADVRAVTTWAAFGSFDWDSLVTVAAGRYEPGAFDSRTDPPTETPLAEVVRRLAAGRTAHLVRKQLGWWQHPDRFNVPAPAMERGQVAADEFVA